MLQHKQYPCANPFTKQVVCWLQTEVSKRVVTDYNKFVPPEKEMWVKKINTKLTRSQYASHNEFQKDIFQILKNARAYNYNPEAVCANTGMLYILATHLELTSLSF